MVWLSMKSVFGGSIFLLRRGHLLLSGNWIREKEDMRALLQGHCSGPGVRAMEKEGKHGGCWEVSQG